MDSDQHDNAELPPKKDGSMKQRTPPAASAAEIGHILGPLDDAVLSEIVALGATASGVLEAFTWATADDQIGTELERGPRGTVAKARRAGRG